MARLVDIAVVWSPDPSHVLLRRKIPLPVDGRHSVLARPAASVHIVPCTRNRSKQPHRLATTRLCVW